MDIDKKDLVRGGQKSERQIAEDDRGGAEKMHVYRMLEAANFMKQPNPQSLDQSYHEDLHEEDLNFLDNDQVIIRFIRNMQNRYSMTAQKSQAAGGSSFASQPKATHTTLRVDTNQATLQEGTDFIVVSNFWLFILDAGMFFDDLMENIKVLILICAKQTQL